MSNESSSPANPAQTPKNRKTNRENLERYAWFAIVIALLTITLKLGAYFVVDSVSLLSDAMESTVNLVAAIVALFALKIAAKPADADYTFGRSKAEYFSAAIEGAMIFGAAALIIFMAILRFINPGELENFGPGLAVSAFATLLNLGAGLYLIKKGQDHNSPALSADGKHLITDVITTFGVLTGVILIWITGWHILDPIFAILVALNIIYIGVGLIRESLSGLLDATLPAKENRLVIDILHSHRAENVTFHGLQTRVSGRMRYLNVDLQVPGSWTVKQGHDLAQKIEEEIQAVLENAETKIHIEPIEDPVSYEDIPEGFVPIDDADAFTPPSSK